MHVALAPRTTGSDVAHHRCRTGRGEALGPADTEGSLTARFRRMAREHRDCLAVEDAQGRMTYGELERRAGVIARAMAAKGGPPGTPVALLLHQGVPSVAATLGALFAARPYVPLDPSDPPAAVAAILDEVGARLLVVDREGAPAAAALVAGGARALLVHEDVGAGPGWAGPDPGPEATACIHFTSGSTGAPKGVVDVHGNVLHNAMRYTATLGITPADRLSLIQAPSFSGVMSSVFGALLNGAALFPVRVTGERAGDLAAYLRDRRITIYHSVPAIFRSMLAVDGGSFPDVRVVRLEGDRASSLDAGLHRRRFAPASILANGLGTTETGLCRQMRLSMTDPVDEGLLPVGYAVPGIEVAVVGEDGRALPPGTAGEIAVRGRHLAPGYWRRPDLTAAAFTADGADPRLRTYRTGDLGRMAPDGRLEYLGRRDGGMKVGGRRVEPAEVEARLLELPGVAEAAVVTEEGRRGEGRLSAFVVPEGDGVDTATLRERLRERLPAAMVPAAMTVVPALPLTSSGKIDRGALRPVAAEAVPPRDASEARLLRLWEEVLERAGFGVEDDFFALGGDSLAVAELLAALEQRLGRPLPDSLVVRAPTVARMAAALGADPAGVAPGGIVPLRSEAGGVPLTVVHGVDFGTGPYAGLVRGLGAERPVWALEAPSGTGLSIDDLAARHAAALEAVRPGGPHLVAGYCSGGIIALEVARALRARGAEVALLALIGVGVQDFPGLVTPAAARRDRHSRRPDVRLRRHLSRRPPGGRLRHHGRAAWSLVHEARTVAARLRPSRRRDPGRAALERHRPPPLEGQAVLYLSAEAVSRYSDRPEADWSGLASQVRVELLPVGQPDILREPMVDALVERLRSGIAARGL